MDKTNAATIAIPNVLTYSKFGKITDMDIKVNVLTINRWK
ncbi:hypothetical protein MPD5_1013 [Melissococcus plutonius DAT561]|nr:hypothetical protein MPD5_1013 [Melissococcus plutonius DAT561]